MSRLHPSKWPTGTGTALFFAWLAYAIASTVWLRPLLWTVLPVGLTLYLIAAWYPPLVIVLFVLPLTLITAFSQLVAISPDVSIWAGLAVYLIACGYFSFVVTYANLDRWIARLPSWFLGEQFIARVAWARFEEAAVAANAVVRQLSAGRDQIAMQAAIQRLAIDARREAGRGGIWQEAWTAQAAWLDELGELIGRQPTADELRHLNDLLEVMNGAHMVAIERSRVVD
jgi:hypothetical protein